MGSIETLLLEAAVRQKEREDSNPIDKHRAADSRPQFKYEPLHPSDESIRILILDPGPWAAPIHCRLEHTKLSENREYEALSYVWGDPTTQEIIRLHDYDHVVTVNLEIALRYLRYEDAERHLWVDALCINQQDLKERSDQVKKMGKIYGGAQIVVAWTGVANEDSNEAISLMKNLPHFGGRYPNPFEWMQSFGTSEFDISPLKAWCSRQNWAPLWNFFDREYWTRIWILQELLRGGPHGANASGLCLIMCGHEYLNICYYEVTCEIISSISMRYGAEFMLEKIEPIVSLQLQGLASPGLIMHKAMLDCVLHSSKSLGWILRSGGTGRLNATDERDKVHAILGLAPDRYQAFPVDYTKPLTEMAMDLVQFLVQEDGNLNSLLGSRELISEPSWIPELSLSTASSCWDTDAYSFRAGGVGKPVVEFNRTSKTLHAQGIMVGRLHSVIEGPHAAHGAQSSSVSDLVDKTGFGQFDKQIYEFGCTLSEEDGETLWRTLILSHDHSGLAPTPAPENFGPIYANLYAPELIKPGNDGLPLNFQRLFPFFQSVEKTVPSRCFFTTEDGEMGLGPYPAKIGDLAVMLYGADFILVLRERGAQYELIGDAYVHGIMNGELATGDNKVNSRVFDIC